MSIIALKAAIAAGTGTGQSFTAYDMKGSSAVYREMAPTGVAGILSLKRTEPRATKDYAGAMRGEIKLTRQMPDANGRAWPVVFTVTSSLPAFLTDTQRVAFITEGLLASLDPIAVDVLSKLIVPQS